MASTSRYISFVSHSRVAIDLKAAAIALQYPLSMVHASSRRIGEGHTWRRRAAPRTLIAGQSPEVSDFGLFGSRIEDRGARFVHKQLGGAL